IPVNQYNARRAAFTADASKVISSEGGSDAKSWPAEIAVWDVASAKRVFAIRLPNHSMTDAALTPDGKQLVTVCRKPAEKGPGDFVIYVWELPGGAKKREFSEPAAYGAGLVATAGDNQTAAVVTSHGKLVRFDITTGKATPIPTGIDSIATPPV